MDGFRRGRGEEDCSNILNSWLPPNNGGRRTERGCNFNVGKGGREKTENAASQRKSRTTKMKHFDIGIGFCEKLR